VRGVETAGRAGRLRVPAKTDPAFAVAPRASLDVDARGLARRLSREIGGEVRFGAESRALYATDASNFRQVPIGVVVPRSIDDVAATHAACREFGAPITCRGAGTSLSGETVNVAVIVDFSKYLRGILEIDPERRLARVEPGAINEEVNHAAGRHGLVFGPDPSTHAYCTIGGNIGNNSCGVHSVQAQFEGDGGRTSDNVHALEILTYDGARFRVGCGEEGELDAIVAAGGRRGEIYRALRELRDRHADEIRERFVDIPRRVSGYNLDELLPEKGFNVARALAGTEGTCATVLEATLNLVPNPTECVLLVIAYDDIASAGDHCAEIMAHRPLGLEAIDHRLFLNEKRLHLHTRELGLLPEGGAWLLVEFGADTAEEAEARAREVCAELEGDRVAPDAMKVLAEPSDQRAIWDVREAGLGATAFPPDRSGEHWPGWEDSAVPPERVGEYARDLQRLYDDYGYVGAMYGHLGQGCIHSRIDFDLRTADGIARYRSFLEDAADLVVSYGGSLSGEHGDGQQRAELLPRMFGERLVGAFREFKRIWDPDWKMNPGKVVDAYRLDENLKLGTGYNPPRTDTAFGYPDDGGDFAHATVRCVGVGKCRIPTGAGVMCPSYIVTQEEQHTTRGRARLLYEMLQGEVVEDGWRSDEVFDALDLCLSCKGCTNDCPVNVDMPTYKAEFLHHYYEGRLRPRHAYAFGLIDRAARIGSLVPELTNLATGTPLLSRLAKLAAGIAPERQIPRFAPLTLRAWYLQRGGPRVEGGRRVILWADTFTNHFHPAAGVAAVEALEAAGYRVELPTAALCCGRPLYDYGFLDRARSYLEQVLDHLRPEIRAGIPLVGLEPSCLATFKDELPKLMPHDDDARRLAHQARHFGEFLEDEQVELPRLDRTALVWGHCHHKATGGMDAEHAALRRMGVDVRPLEGGCCGLAGSFGFEADHYELSVAAGEHALLPAVREAARTDLVVANGFSCRTQIEQAGTGRRALHLAEVIALAREQGPAGPPGGTPEAAWGDRRPRPSAPRRLTRLGAAAAAVGLAGAAAVAAARRLA
jgi:FAD/FMN-containing dehydrogenase/Fe-S oxidoreductase